MKKFIAALLILVISFSLVACGCTPTPPAPTTEPEPTDQGTEPALKIGFIYLHDENSTYDLNFLNAAREVCEEMGVEAIHKVGIPEGQECYEAAVDLVDRGCSIIFADSFGHEDYLIQAALENPDVEFCHATGTKAHTQNLPNFHNAFASIYQGRFLAGIAAGLKLTEMIEEGQFEPEEAIIGYVGAFPYAEVKSGYTAFYLGARAMCPSATMLVQFTSSWYDEAMEKEAANNLIAKGCKLISQHADSMGAPTACENAGVPNVSYNGSTLAACPNTFIVSTRIDWAPYFRYIINCVENGEPIATDWVGDISSGSVVMTEINDRVAAQGTAGMLATLMEALEKGELQVFDTETWTINYRHMSSYKADVDSDDAYTPDTEVIADGYFHESEYRSAPYFDLTIDGITLLDGN